MDEPGIVLVDETGRSLPCSVEQTIEVANTRYLILMPLDIPIEIFMWQADDESDAEVLIDIEETDIEALLPSAKAVLSEQNMSLLHSALTLTATGEVPELTEENSFTLELSDDDVSDLAAEEFQILATFFHEDNEYTVCTPVEPLLFFAQQSQNGITELLSPEEFQRIRTELEDKLFDALD
ncbi:MAG: DUF3727 domain-containing protein [Cyanobacteria bacterium P01_H01_bin.119]